MKASLQAPVAITDPSGTSFDVIAEDDVKVEILKETGFKDRFKLYVHANLHTLVRVCKLRAEDIELAFPLLTAKEDQLVRHKFTMHDWGALEQQFKDAIGNLPNYRREAIWNYVRSLKEEIEYAQEQVKDIALHNRDLRERERGES